MNDTSPVFPTRSGFNTTPARRLFSGLAVKSAAAVFEYLRKDIRIFSKTTGSSHRPAERGVVIRALINEINLMETSLA
jgi:hypothetical protein